jgi:hypothetical protein
MPAKRIIPCLSFVSLRHVLAAGNTHRLSRIKSSPSRELLSRDREGAQGPPDAVQNNRGAHRSNRDSAAITCARSSGAGLAEFSRGPLGPAIMRNFVEAE